jgi:aldose 1-epimerase
VIVAIKLDLDACSYYGETSIPSSQRGASNIVGLGLMTKEKQRIQKQLFGATADGRRVDLYTLTNANGLEAGIMNYGGVVVSVRVPDRRGSLGDVVLGYDKLDGYLKKGAYFGALIGRYGNRIGNGRFSLDGQEYKLAQNNGENHLHGGLVGFDKVLWNRTESPTDDVFGLKLTYLSKDREEGYPGNLSVTVIYTLTNKDELKLSYSAMTDKPTVVNLTNHSFFNLAGSGSNLGHEMMINADRFTPVAKGLIPTGELRGVKGTPMDFSTATAIGARIDQDYEQLTLAGGYDHNYVLNKRDSELSLAARVSEPSTGRVMEVYTTEPGMQFYSGNFLDGSIAGKGGQAYHRRSAFCLETQHFPDSPNKPGFPSTVLRPGQHYSSNTIYKFSVRK